MAGHRSTLTKANKSFKSPHSSKRSLKALNKGKVEKAVANNKAIKVQTKEQRKNQSKQLKQNKINKTSVNNALFNSNKIERIITILPLTKNQSVHDIINKLLTSNDIAFEVLKTEANIITVKVEKFKSTLKFIIPEMNNLLAILDACKISDFIIFGLSASEEVEPEFGEQIIRAVEAQGISTTYAVLPDIVSRYPKRNLQLDVYKSLFSYYQHFFPNVEKLFALENKSDSLNLLRNLCQKVPKGIHWRDSRGYLLADHLDKIQIDETTSVLTIDGTVRGTGFNVNGLIHLPGFGDFQIEKIEKLVKVSDIEAILPSSRESLSPLKDEEEADLKMDEMDDDDDVESFGDDYDYQDEDDWNLVNKAVVPKRSRLPKGMSEYQARWLKDEEIETLIAEVGLEGEDNNDEDDDIADVDDEEVMEGDDIDGNDDAETMEMDASPEEHQRQLEEYRQREREELDFPDRLNYVTMKLQPRD